jgi:hypothetical protein
MDTDTGTDTNYDSDMNVDKDMGMAIDMDIKGMLAPGMGMKKNIAKM